MNKCRKFNEYLNNCIDYSIPSDYVPQGICIANDYILVTCFHIKHKKSIIVVLKNEKQIDSITLPNNAHVGGIAYHEATNRIYITEKNGHIISMTLKELLSSNFKKVRKHDIASKVLGGSELIEKGNPVCSYMTIDGDTLYVGSFNKVKKGLVKVYNIKDDLVTYKSEFRVPRFIQGITIFDYSKKKYMMLSSSLGTKLNSKLRLYEFNNKKLRYIFTKNTIKLPPMVEQVVYNNKELFMIFESKSSKYKSKVRDNQDDIISLDIAKYIRNN